MDALIVENNIFSNIKCKQTCSELRVYIKDWSPCSGATAGLVCSTGIWVVSSCTGTQKKETITNCVITPCMVMKTKGIPSCTGTPGQPRYLSLHTWNLNSICRVVILAQTLFLLCSRRAVELPHRLHSPCPKPQRGHLILQLDGREVEIHCRLPDHARFFHFLVF